MVYGKDEIMTIKMIGALLIIAGCGGIGFALCLNHKRQEEALTQLIHSLQWMRCELNYRMTPLPELCRGAAGAAKGIIGQFFETFALELEQQFTPDAITCMQAAIRSLPELPEVVSERLMTLGTSLGQFDLQGQLLAIESAQLQCQKDLTAFNQDKEIKLRNYRVIGLCAGIAMVLLFI